jgi:hypothetical protein
MMPLLLRCERIENGGNHADNIRVFLADSSGWMKNAARVLIRKADPSCGNGAMHHQQMKSLSRLHGTIRGFFLRLCR